MKVIVVLGFCPSVRPALWKWTKLKSDMKMIIILLTLHVNSGLVAQGHRSREVPSQPGEGDRRLPLAHEVELGLGRISSHPHLTPAPMCPQ